MKISDTELEYTDSDQICLEYFLGEGTETMEAWAQRVWKNCKRWQEGHRTDENGKKLAQVYSRTPESLWEEKKRRRRAAFVKRCTGKNCDNNLLECKNIIEDVERGIPCDWPESHSDTEILRIKNDPASAYKTATERHREEGLI